MSRGEWFRRLDRPGQVYQFMYERNGELTFFGGDRKPSGRRQYETFSADVELIPAKAPFTRRQERDYDNS